MASGVGPLLANHVGVTAALAPRRRRSLIVVPVMGLGLAALDVMAFLVSLELGNGVESLAFVVLAALLACAITAAASTPPSS